MSPTVDLDIAPLGLDKHEEEKFAFFVWPCGCTICETHDNGLTYDIACATPDGILRVAREFSPGPYSVRMMTINEYRNHEGCDGTCVQEDEDWTTVSATDEGVWIYDTNEVIPL